MLNSSCNLIHGVPVSEALSSDTILLGSILPYTGDLSDYGPQIAQGIMLAVDEINQTGGVLGKKIAVILCDSATNAEDAQKAAKHLIDVARVSAIIGPAASSVTIGVFTEVIKDADVVLISPSATSPLITTQDDDDYLWRTVPSDALQGAAIAHYLMQEEFSKIAIINRRDAYGDGLRDSINEKLCETFPCGDKNRYFNRSYSELTYQNDQSEIILDLAEFEPDVTVIIAFHEDGSNLLKTAADIELGRVVLSDSLKIEGLFTLNLKGKTLCRLLGTQPASPTGKIYQSFKLRYKAQYGKDDGAYSANAYDALFLIAYAIAATDVDNISGSNIIRGLRRLSKGDKIPAGSSEWNTASQLLASDSKTKINYEGASGPLDFDINGESTSDIEGWALDLDDESMFSLGVIYTYSGIYEGIDVEIPSRGAVCEELDKDK
ncbi:MAG: ABC transporter substrate-binding protein [Proteobacteria bacterium]|nr:ABC transporter substrate-binding protein [Pseudomonadota bacterium]